MKMIKAKRFLLILLAPFLMATQCEDDFNDSGFETTYLIENDTSIDLFLLREDNSFEVIVARSSQSIGSELNSETSPIVPSESFVFSNLKLYKSEDDNFILVYEQNPIINDLWIFNEPTMNRFEYTLILTEESID